MKTYRTPCDSPALPRYSAAMKTDAQQIAARALQKGQELGHKSERAICVAAGVGVDFLRHLRIGKNKTPKTENLAKLADFLGVTTDWLVYGDSRTNHSPDTGEAVTLDQQRLLEAILVVRQAQATIGPAADDLPPEVEAGFLRIAYEGVRDRTPEDLVRDMLVFLGRIGLTDLTAQASGA